MLAALRAAFSFATAEYHTFLLLFFILEYTQKKEVKKYMENKKTKALSMTSTILLTIYTIFMVLAEVGMFAICNFVAHMVNSGVSIASDGIASGGCISDYTLPGTAIGGMFAGLGSLTWIAVAAVMVLFIVICIIYITVTAISYMLLRRGLFKADAWMKIAVFGVTFLGVIVSANLSGLQMLCITILLLLPIVISVMVLFSECQCQCCECKKDDSVNLRSPSPDTDGVSDSLHVSNNLKTDGQPEVGRGLPSFDDTKMEEKETKPGEIKEETKEADKPEVEAETTKEETEK